MSLHSHNETNGIHGSVKMSHTSKNLMAESPFMRLIVHLIVGFLVLGIAVVAASEVHSASRSSAHAFKL